MVIHADRERIAVYLDVETLDGEHKRASDVYRTIHAGTDYIAYRTRRDEVELLLPVGRELKAYSFPKWCAALLK
jgi:hypothetical protein